MDGYLLKGACKLSHSGGGGGRVSPIDRSIATTVFLVKPRLKNTFLTVLLKECSHQGCSSSNLGFLCVASPYMLVTFHGSCCTKIKIIICVLQEQFLFGPCKLLKYGN